MVYHKISQDFFKLAKLPPRQQKMETSISENQVWGGLTFPYSFLHWKNEEIPPILGEKRGHILPLSICDCLALAKAAAWRPS